MTKSPREEEATSCFAWCIQIKKSVNERWARARNRLRQRFHANNGTPIKPEDLLNDTGMPEMDIVKIPVKDKTPTPTPESLTDGKYIGLRALAKPSDENEADGKTTDGKMVIRGAVDGGPDCDDVRQFVMNSIKEASHRYKAEMGILPPPPTPRDFINTDTVVEEDTASLSSSVISALAEVAVSESLSKVVEDMNESARTNVTSPRTVTEVLERMSIDPNIGIMTRDPTSMPPNGIKTSPTIRVGFPTSFPRAKTRDESSRKWE